MAVKPKIIQGGVSFGDEALANYDEGTWTPGTSGTPTNITGTPSYGTATYTRIGNTVFARIEGITGCAITTVDYYTYISIESTGLPGVVNATQFIGGANISISASPYDMLPGAIADLSGGNTLIFLQIGSQAGLGVVSGDAISIGAVYFQYRIT